MVTLNVNGVSYSLDVDPSMPLLWALRDVIGLIGTKYGCGIEVCGACTVLLNGDAERSCERHARKPTSHKGHWPCTTCAWPSCT